MHCWNFSRPSTQKYWKWISNPLSIFEATLYFARILLTQFSFQFAIMDLSADFLKFCGGLCYLVTAFHSRRLLYENVKANKVPKLVLANKSESCHVPIWNQDRKLWIMWRWRRQGFKYAIRPKELPSAPLSSRSAILIIFRAYGKNHCGVNRL